MGLGFGYHWRNGSPAALHQVVAALARSPTSERDYAALQALRCIIERGSFVAAARELRVSRSALSETIRQFEQRLGIQLLNRTTRSVSPTPTGERLAARFDAAAGEIEAALQEASDASGEASGTVRVHAQRLGYETVLKPFLPGFVDGHPRIMVEVEIDDADIDIVPERFDLGIRLGELLDQDVVAVMLQPPMRQIAVASPGYLQRHGTPEHPRDLLRHRCIGFRWPGHDAVYSWEFFENGAWFSVPVSGPLTFNDQRATVDAAIAGAGIAFWVQSAIQHDLEAGRLVPLLTAYSADFPGFALYYPRHRHRSSAVDAFIAALRRNTRR